MKFFNGNCLDVMKDFPDNSIDTVICDPPYGTTECKWDSIIPLDKMWEELYRVAKDTAPIVLCCQQPFTSQLVMSNVKDYSHNWVWDKGYSTNVGNCNKMPMKGFEDVLVFWRKRGTYNPQGLIKLDKPKIKKRDAGEMGPTWGDTETHNSMTGKEYVSEYTNYPNGIIRTKREFGDHPTAKAVSLMEYLVLTYSNEDDIVLDFTMGSGTTGLACKMNKRDFWGIEMNNEFYQIAKTRIENYNDALVQLLT